MCEEIVIFERSSAHAVKGMSETEWESVSIQARKSPSQQLAYKVEEVMQCTRLQGGCSLYIV